MFIFQLLFAFAFSDITFTFLSLVAPANIFCRLWHLHTRPIALSSFLLAGRAGTADWDIAETFGLLVTDPFLLVPCRDGVSCWYQTQTFHFSTLGILAFLGSIYTCSWDHTGSLHRTILLAPRRWGTHTGLSSSSNSYCVPGTTSS